MQAVGLEVRVAGWPIASAGHDLLTSSRFAEFGEDQGPLDAEWTAIVDALLR